MPDTSPVAALVNRYGPRLLAIATRMCGNRADAEDVVQDTFLQAHRAWNQFQHRSDPGTWLYTIAARRCRRRYIRPRTRHPMPAFSDLAPFRDRGVANIPLNSPGAPERAVTAEHIRALHRAIEKLPIDFRLPLVLKDIAEMSLIEVGQALGIKPDTAKTRVHRARLLLRAELMKRTPQRPAPEPTYERSLCLDLLAAKLSALDAGRAGTLPQRIVCERCRAVFAELDMTRSACARLAEGDLPPRLRRAIQTHLAAESSRHIPGTPAPRRASNKRQARAPSPAPKAPGGRHDARTRTKRP